MTEKELQANVVKLAKLRGWLCYHTYDSRRSEPGFPDLVLVKGISVLFIELKSQKGRLSDAQARWLIELEGARQWVGVWRPSHWKDGTIERTLA